MHEKRTNSIGQCMYMYLCTVSSEGSRSSMKDQLYGNSTCTKSSCQKEYYLYNININTIYIILILSCIIS